MYVSDSHIHILDILELETCKCTARDLVWGGFGGWGDFVLIKTLNGAVWCYYVVIVFIESTSQVLCIYSLKNRKNYKY